MHIKRIAFVGFDTPYVAVERHDEVGDADVVAVADIGANRNFAAHQRVRAVAEVCCERFRDGAVIEKLPVLHVISRRKVGELGGFGVGLGLWLCECEGLVDHSEPLGGSD